VIAKSIPSLDNYHTQVALALKSVAQEDIDEVIESIIRTVVSNQVIWIVGNGGSSATASHFAADLMRPGNQEKYRVRAMSLGESIPRVTAIGNDFSFEEVFERQIRGFASSNDLLILLSASGNSPNLIRGIRRAKEMKLLTISLVGFQGGILKSESHNTLHFKTDLGAYEAAEDAHSIVCHYIAMTVRAKLEIV
jgi:D-sedoheptulose 7-phosphate isomerase